MQKNKLAEMISICEYFRRNSQTRHLFNSEFEAAQKINSLIGQSSVISTDKAGELIAVFNEVNKSEHYNGSGWRDYKMHFMNILQANGIEVSLSEEELRLTD